MLPRKRVTSLTLASILIFSFWYIFFHPEVSTEDISPTFGIPPKTRPNDAKLTVEDPSRELNPPPQEPLVDVSPDVIADTRPPPSLEPGSATSVPDSISKPDTKLKTGTTPIEDGELKSASEQGSGSTSLGKDQSSRWRKGQYTFGDRKFKPKHPVKSFQGFSQGLPLELPKLQHQFEHEEGPARIKRLERLAAVKESFVHSWRSYKKYAWKQDELSPIDGKSRESFGGWGATLVDTLDSLWIMGLKDDFEEAVDAVKDIDFTKSGQKLLNIFEVTIRYLGGLLGAYDVSEGKYPVLLQKAVEIGELLYCAFDTPNRMPATRWNWEAALEGEKQEASTSTLLAEIGSLTLEFTRLSQLTGDLKYHDAISRIMEEFRKAQGATLLPGLWPTLVNAHKMSFDDNGFTLGGMADSVYEYLPKEYLLLGGRGEQPSYKEMYEFAITAAMNHVFFQPMLPGGADVLISGDADVNPSTKEVRSIAKGQHLGCYAGGMVGIGAKAFNQPEHLHMARKLVDGCIWAYDHMPTGIMPEIFEMVACEMNSECPWDEAKWRKAVLKTARNRRKSSDPEIIDEQETINATITKLSLRPGFVDIQDKSYILRPEAIESVFVHYRLTGEPDLLDAAWRMFTAIENHTRTEYANAGIHDVTAKNPEKMNFMESFWLAETLKYFYLMFSDPDVLSLDEFVLNTEAHPFRRPVPGKPVATAT